MRIAALCFSLASMLVFAQSSAPGARSITATVQHFHEALAKGDRQSAIGLLASDAVILESGVSETRVDDSDQSYRRHLQGFRSAERRWGTDGPAQVGIRLANSRHPLVESQRNRDANMNFLDARCECCY